MATFPIQPGLHHHGACTDHVVGAILSGWRYDISGIAPHLRGAYEDHLSECAHCRSRQRLHRTVDMLLFAATTISFATCLLAALMLHRLRAWSHLSTLHIHLLPDAGMLSSRLAASTSVSLQAIAILGLLVSMLLWLLVTVATPVPDMVSGMVRERISHEERDPLHKRAA